MQPYTRVLVLIAALTVIAAGGQPDASQTSAPVILGNWNGTSTCLVKPSACHDEEALYHFNVTPKKPGVIAALAYKIVNGKPQYMGPADCTYDPAKKLLHCDFPRGYIDLTFSSAPGGDRLEGAMFLPDKTRWRDIKLKRK